jgi:hypothetical protein
MIPPRRENRTLWAPRISLGHLKLLFSRRRFFGALPEFIRGWAGSAFCSGDADRDRFRLRSDVQKFHTVPKTVTKVRGNGDAGSRFDGRHNGGKTVVLRRTDRFHNEANHVGRSARWSSHQRPSCRSEADTRFRSNQSCRGEFALLLRCVSGLAARWSMPASYAEARNMVFPKNAVRGRSLFTDNRG